jgi:hypothetical protein
MALLRVACAHHLPGGGSPAPAGWRHSPVAGSGPVSALVALPDGRYALQVVSGQKVVSVPVKTGVFVQGKVQVSGSGIAEGAVVGVPK